MVFCVPKNMHQKTIKNYSIRILKNQVEILIYQVSNVSSNIFKSSKLKLQNERKLFKGELFKIIDNVWIIFKRN